MPAGGFIDTPQEGLVTATGYRAPRRVTFEWPFQGRIGARNHRKTWKTQFYTVEAKGSSLTSRRGTLTEEQSGFGVRRLRCIGGLVSISYVKTLDCHGRGRGPSFVFADRILIRILDSECRGNSRRETDGLFVSHWTRAGCRLRSSDPPRRTRLESSASSRVLRS